MRGAENKFFTWFRATLALPRLQPALGDREGPGEEQGAERGLGVVESLCHADGGSSHAIGKLDVWKTMAMG